MFWIYIVSWILTEPANPVPQPDKYGQMPTMRPAIYMIQQTARSKVFMDRAEAFDFLRDAPQGAIDSFNLSKKSPDEGQIKIKLTDSQIKTLESTGWPNSYLFHRPEN